MTTKTNLLFLCTGNSCRSQMAEGWAKHLKSDIYNVYSAGIETHGLNPYAVKVMAEAGIDISTQTSDNIADMDVGFDVVVTVCGHAHETCPVAYFKNARIVHVGFEDPPKLAHNIIDENAKLAIYRKVRDEIKSFVMGLPESLGF